MVKHIRSHFVPLFYLYLYVIHAYVGAKEYYAKGKQLTSIPILAKPQQFTGARLNNNNLTDIGENAFARWTSLKGLYLHKNQITTIASSAFTGTKIQVIEMHTNRLTCIPDLRTISSTLQFLILNSNRLGQCNNTNDKCSARFDKLKGLFFENNGLTLLPKIVFCTKSLQILKLGYNSFTTLPDLNYLLVLKPEHRSQFSLNNNMLLCNCDSAWMKEYETRYNVGIMVRDPYICSSGLYSRMPWANLTFDDVTSCCNSTVCDPTTTQG